VTDLSCCPVFSMMVSKVFGGEKFVTVSTCTTGSHDSVVSVKTSYGLYGPGFESQQG
jgi:hypothetical protein